MFCSASSQKINHSTKEITRTAFQKTIQKILQDSLLQQSQIGIKIISLDSGDVIFESKSHLLFHPASNMKLFTTGVALKKLGPDFQSSTLLLADSFGIEQESLNGNLYLKGYGNSTFKDGDLEKIGLQLRAMGIRKINGDIICDDSAFDDLYRGKGWNWDDASTWKYAPISALSVNENCVDLMIMPGASPAEPAHWKSTPNTSYVKIVNKAVTVDPMDSLKLQQFRVYREWIIPQNIIHISGGVALNAPEKIFRLDIVDAPLYTGTRLKEVLEMHGIEVSGEVRRGGVGSETDTLFVISSSPLRALINDINKNSNNFASEMLLKNLGAHLKGFPGTAEKGLSIIKEFLSELGMDSSECYLADGSGVSRYNLISVDMIIQFLEYMFQDQHLRDIYKSSLSIAGMDGELKDRMHNGSAFQRVYGKTGTLQGVSVLSGYVRSLSGENIAFSIMIQHFVGSINEIRNLQDKISHLIAGFDRRKTIMKVQSQAN
jgi:D-alanyl-D-alanine carboxypeptidase/D-alanyl-D-alanine-endopeptidase (penicillin-binding protein 4)